ncbi:hypothetical protein [Rhizobium laguerreae]|uniref:hypothetical protein n=1 Tax=Rhizobium laguerreae TaxID=1076926 RepID=UPI001C906B00|nr:hypothetical protein [Rhizobium laguerreae]MBY3207044.1 hypothetical protein [Rhizobium laguerreae]
MNKKTIYSLEVYEPGDDRSVAIDMKSDTPFGSISVGDEISSPTMRIGDRLKATKIWHIFWELDTHITHKICVSTTSVQH